MTVPLWAWAAFAAVIVVMLAIDLFAHRDAHVITFRQAAWWSGLWVGLSLVFAVVVALTLGGDAGVDFTTAWLLEKSLSVDNLFVFALIFGYFQVPRKYQHRVLFFGVLGALVFRGIFLALGVAVVNRFSAVLFVFAAILLWSAYKLIKDDEETVDPGKSLAVRLLRKIMPVRDEYAGGKFFVMEAGRRVATPLLAVVVAIEAADLVFAVDSVPAVLAVSDETFIVYSSNAFAILGLRSLYFLLSGLLEKFHYLSKGLAIILAFIGAKLILQAGHKVISPSIPEIPSLVSLGVIVVVLTASVVLSLRRPVESIAVGLDEGATDAGSVESLPTESGLTGSGLTGSVPTGSVPTGSVLTESVPTESGLTESGLTESLLTESTPTGSVPTGSVPTGGAAVDIGVDDSEGARR